MVLHLPPEAYLWFKTFHVIGVVVWFAGLFYWVRLFIYHVEADTLGPDAQAVLKPQYTLMEKRLASIITTPGMVVTVAMAVGLLATDPGWLHQSWLHVKLAFVALLLAYHLFCYRLMGQLEQGVCTWSSGKLRALNEAPTLLLVVIVMLAVFKAQFPTGYATWLVAALVVFMALAIQLYARKRRRDAEQQALSQGT